MDDYLEILEWTLQAGHISPTAPDTLGIVRDGEGWGVVEWGALPGVPPLISTFLRLLPLLQI